jgi:OOP family OmpA-OmpF porin
MSRSTLETNEDFIIGPEVQWNNGVRVALPAATRMAFTGQVMSRAGLKAFLQGGAENAVEAMGGIQVLPSKAVTLDLGAGRGLTEGYGTTDLRVMSAIMIQHVPKPPPRPIVEEEPPPPPPPPPPPIVEDEPPAEVVFEEGELAKVHFDKIEIAEMPEFIVDTNVLKGEQSYEILTAVGKVLNEKAEIGHIVVEGHASQEGSFNHNYTLSESRARRIYEELIKVGVHPDRMSYRGKGEIAPLVLGEDEASLQANRRVEFHILFQHEEVEDMPDYPDTTILPWNGEVVPVVQPPKPEPPAEPEETGPRVDEFGLPLDDDEEMEIDLGPMPTDEDAAEDTDAEQE